MEIRNAPHLHGVVSHTCPSWWHQLEGKHVIICFYIVYVRTPQWLNLFTLNRCDTYESLFLSTWLSSYHGPRHNMSYNVMTPSVALPKTIAKQVVVSSASAQRIRSTCNLLDQHDSWTKTTCSFRLHLEPRPDHRTGSYNTITNLYCSALSGHGHWHYQLHGQVCWGISQRQACGGPFRQPWPDPLQAWWRLSRLMQRLGRQGVLAGSHATDLNRTNVRL